jgi:hypothetical protein
VEIAIFWIQFILGLYGVWISWRDGSWWLALTAFLLPLGGLVVAVFWLLGDVNIPARIMQGINVRRAN